MENLTLGDLHIEVVNDGSSSDPIRVWWKGKSTDRQPGKVLGPFFKGVLAKATERKVPVEMHFEKLSHFNSSTISSIIQTIQDARGHGVKLVLVYDHDLKWQKLSFDALRVFA